jgi:hypothetical protein
MTLHEAIIKVLQSKNRAMSTQEIADKLNKNKWYVKKDKSTIEAFQIHGRTRNYSHLFDRNGSMVSLKDQSFKSNLGIIRKKTMKPLQKSTGQEKFTDELTEKILMNDKSFKSAGTIDNSVPDIPGLYCIRINEPKKLPTPFSTELENQNHNNVYIGIATQSLYRRMLNQELRANGHGTFFRSLGAILGYRPPHGSLIEKKNKRNYKFNSADERKIIDWINDNLKINWVKFDNDFETIETSLIIKYKPILNISKNPYSIQRLSELRKECVGIANRKVSI